MQVSYLREPLGTGMVAQTRMAALQEQWHHHHHQILNMYNSTAWLSTRWPAASNTATVYRLKVSLTIKGMHIYIMMEFHSIFLLSG